MPERSRRSIVSTWIATAICAIGICCWLTWDWATYLTEERVRAEKTAEYHDNYAENAIAEKCLSLEPISMRDCIHEEIESARNHERSEQDLDAQQAMAKFTRVMGYTAIVGLALGVVSIGVIYVTFREMGQTNQIMKEDQRAWVTIDIEYRKVDIYHVNGRPEATIWVKLHISNVGRSVAERVHVSIRHLPGFKSLKGLSPEVDRIFSEVSGLGGRVLLPGEKQEIASTMRFPIEAIEQSADRMNFRHVSSGNGPDVPYWLAMVSYKSQGGKARNTAKFGIVNAGNGKSGWKFSRDTIQEVASTISIQEVSIIGRAN